MRGTNGLSQSMKSHWHGPTLAEVVAAVIEICLIKTLLMWPPVTTGVTKTDWLLVLTHFSTAYRWEEPLTSFSHNTVTFPALTLQVLLQPRSPALDGRFYLRLLPSLSIQSIGPATFPSITAFPAIAVLPTYIVDSCSSFPWCCRCWMNLRLLYRAGWPTWIVC